MIPQFLMLSMIFLNIVFGAALHGERKGGEHNIISDILCSGITFWILYAGGFFAVLGWGGGK